VSRVVKVAETLLETMHCDQKLPGKLVKLVEPVEADDFKAKMCKIRFSFAPEPGWEAPAECRHLAVFEGAYV